MSSERALNFDQWKIFFENYKPIRVWLWLVYKFTKNNCRFWRFFVFIQTKRRYPTSLDKISILTWKLLFISSQNFSCELNSQRNYSLLNSLKQSQYDNMNVFVVKTIKQRQINHLIVKWTFWKMQWRWLHKSERQLAFWIWA